MDRRQESRGRLPEQRDLHRPVRPPDRMLDEPSDEAIQRGWRH
jgi:hypothetical protein